MFQSYYLIKGKKDLRNTIIEKVLIESIFNKDRSYIILYRVVVNK